MSWNFSMIGFEEEILHQAGKLEVERAYDKPAAASGQNF